MRSLIFILLVSFSVIHANFLNELFSSQSTTTSSGISFTLKAANPMNYVHKIGGSYYDSISGALDGYYYACGEIVTMFLEVSSTSTYSGSSSFVYNLDISSHSALKLKSVVNNCDVNAQWK